MFAFGPRINHSCIPKIHFAWNSSVEKETFHVVRDIAVDEELFIMYNLGTNRTRKQRQLELDKYEFLCDCPACENTIEGKKREEKRAQLFTLDQELA